MIPKRRKTEYRILHLSRGKDPEKKKDEQMINREDMLELTRRMTPARNCFGRIAGAYMDEEGYDHSTFNLHFRKLPVTEARRNMEMAKAIPFAKTNEQLKEYRFPKGEERKKSM